jgi:NTP pyrophosphatase (non-canonical NTP hydrolase)
MEAYRSGNPESEKIPGFSQMEEELADVVIRLLDFAGGENLNIEGALIAKMAYNEKRPYRHGGKLA